MNGRGSATQFLESNPFIKVPIFMINLAENYPFAIIFLPISPKSTFVQANLAEKGPLRSKPSQYG